MIAHWMKWGCLNIKKAFLPKTNKSTFTTHCSATRLSKVSSIGLKTTTTRLTTANQPARSSLNAIQAGVSQQIRPTPTIIATLSKTQNKKKNSKRTSTEASSPQLTKCQQWWQIWQMNFPVHHLLIQITYEIHNSFRVRRLSICTVTMILRIT